MAIDYSKLLSMPQDEAIAYLSSQADQNIGAPQYTVTEPIREGGGEGGFWGAGGRELGRTEAGMFRAPLTPQFDPNYAGGVFGQYFGEYDPQGNLVGVKFDKGERHGGWLAENLDWIGPLVVGGAMLGGSGLLSGLGSSGAGAATAGGSVTLSPAELAAIYGTEGAPMLDVAATVGGGGAGAGAGVPGLGSGTFGMNAAWTTPSLAALESGTLPALTAAGEGVLGATLPSAAAITAGTAASTLPAWLSTLGEKAVDWATNPKTLLSAGLTLADMASRPKTPSSTGSAASAVNPDNRGRVQWDWDRINQAAQNAGLNLNQFVARNFGRLQSGQYDKPVANLARGGALNNIANLARGGGSGRADTIPARLSDGEYVIDAETVALLGDGSTQAGAEQLERMRQAVRQHKGRALARGEFSPDARSPLDYMKHRGR